MSKTDNKEKPSGFCHYIRAAVDAVAFALYSLSRNPQDEQIEQHGRLRARGRRSAARALRPSAGILRPIRRAVGQERRRRRLHYPS